MVVFFLLGARDWRAWHKHRHTTTGEKNFTLREGEEDVETNQKVEEDLFAEEDF